MCLKGKKGLASAWVLERYAVMRLRTGTGADSLLLANLPSLPVRNEHQQQQEAREDSGVRLQTHALSQDRMRLTKFLLSASALVQ